MTSIEELAELAFTLVSKQSKKPLTYIQKIVIRDSLSDNKKTYEQIASENGYSENYVKQGVAPKLWQQLSEVIGEKVNRTNCRSILENQLQKSSETIIQESTKTLHKRTLEIPEGQVSLDSPLYIERGVEQICYQEILQPGACIRIKAPRKMGKTSLMIRILAHSCFENYHIVSLNLSSAENEIFICVKKFLRWLCANVTRQLGLESKLDDYWDEEMGSLINCTIYFREYVLKEISQPVILALDEFDKLFAFPNLASDFQALLRRWNEEAKNICIWQKLRLIIVNSTDVYISLSTNSSPFNIGLTIELPPFTRYQVDNLAQCHELHLKSSELEQLMEITGGFPYLVRLALYHSFHSQITLEKIMKDAISDTGIFGKHLHQQLWYLKQDSDLADAFQNAIAVNAPIYLEQEMAFKLKSLGLVNLEGNKVTISCGLYREYFRNYFCERRTN